MPHTKVFQTRSGGHISIYVPWRNTPIEIMEGGTYETDDQREIKALSDSPEATEVKAPAKDPRKGR